MTTDAEIPEPAETDIGAQRPSGDRDELLLELLADQEARRLRPLTDYLTRYSGDAEFVARCYRLATSFPGTAASPTPFADIRAGGRLAHYRLERELGCGGQGAVYLALDEKLTRRVAVKVLDRRYFGHADARERFRREALMTSRLDHPGICTVYEAGEADGIPYIAMEFIEGSGFSEYVTALPAESPAPSSSFVIGDASTRSDRPPGRPAREVDPPLPIRPPDTAALRVITTLVAKVARALHAAHEAGVIHRDIKPTNLRVRRNGDPVVLDFGMARDIDSEFPSLTRTDDLFGTPPYMSPEQLLGVPLDRRTDLWSLGVTLYECVTGRRPFAAMTAEKLRILIATTEAPDARRFNPDVGKDLTSILAVALEKSRDRRYATALGFAEDLERLARGESVLARPAGRLRRAARWISGHRTLSVAATVVLASLSTGIGVSLRFASEARGQARIADLRADDYAASLEDWERLADVARLEALIREADTQLWPATEDRIPAMNSWLERARIVATRRSHHADALETLRGRALPEANFLRHDPPEFRRTHQERLAVIEAELARNAADADRLSKELGADRERLGALRQRGEDDERAAERAARLAARCEATNEAIRETGDRTRALIAERKRLAEALTLRRSWTFEDPRLQIRHDQMQRFVAGLELLTSDSDFGAPTISSVARRLAFAQSARRRTVEDAREQWSDCLERLAGDARFAPMELAPQIGLLPLGADPVSGLEEFADVLTGVPPERGSDGTLVPTPYSSLVYVLVPGGPDRVGAQATDAGMPSFDRDAAAFEGPPMEVSVTPYLISKFEMTQGQWTRLSGRNPSQYGPNAPGAAYNGHVIDERHPVEQVSCEEALRFLRRIGATLPTEVQWELAARAGTTSPFWTGPDPADLSKAENLADSDAREGGGPAGWSYEAWRDGFTLHAPVGSFRPNPFGLHDMLGNVQEWCLDTWDLYSESRPRAGDGLRVPPERGPTLGVVCRGGSFAGPAVTARASLRLRNAPGVRSYLLGVRPVRPIPSNSQ